MISRPRWSWIERWRRRTWGAPRTRPNPGLGVECLESRFLLSGSDSLLTDLEKEIGLIRALEVAPTSQGDSASGTTPGTPPTFRAEDLSTTKGSNPPTLDNALGTATLPPDAASRIVDLPDLPSCSVAGALNSAQASNFYRVPLDVDTVRLGFELDSDPHSERVAERLLLLDQSGRPIGGAVPSPGSSSVTLCIPISQLMAGATGLLVKIASASDQLGPSSYSWLQPHFYILRITRWGASVSHFPWDSGSNPGQPANAHQEVPDSGSSSSTPSVAPAEGDVPVLIASSIPDDPHLAPLGVSTGPLPARSAAPLGGVLAVGDPVPLINRRDAAAIDLELIGLSPREPDAPAVALADTAEEDATGPQGRLTPVRGPGGFPLLASAPTRSLAAAPAALPWASAPQGSAATPVADLSVPARAASSSRPHSRSRPSVGSGLTFALTLVFGLMLPDLAVAFQLAVPPRTRFRLGGRDDMV